MTKQLYFYFSYFHPCPAFLQAYTFSLIFLPKIPVGFTSNTIISTVNTIASDNCDDMYAFDIFSVIPSKIPPKNAPGIEPIPPNTAATKALIPGMEPV